MDTLEMPVVESAHPVANRAPARARTSPRDRPPLSSRLFVGLLGVGALLTAAALLLSDRAPGALEAVLGERARRLWERIDARARLDLAPGAELPSSDFFVHVAIWAVVAGLIGLAVWSWRWLVVSAVLLTGASAVIELAQGRYAEMRAVEASDMVANATGVALGLTAAAVCYVAWSACAGFVRLLARGLDRSRAAHRG